MRASRRRGGYRNSPRCGGSAPSRASVAPRAQILFELVEAQRRDVRRHARGSRSRRYRACSPSASNVCAPTYERSVQMPSLASTLTSPARSVVEERRRARRSRATAARAASHGVTMFAPAAISGRAAVRVARETVAGGDRGLHPQTGRRQPLVDGAGGEDRRDRQRRAAVVEHEVGRAVAHRALGIVARSRRCARAASSAPQSSAMRCGTSRAS